MCRLWGLIEHHGGAHSRATRTSSRSTCVAKHKRCWQWHIGSCSRSISSWRSFSFCEVPLRPFPYFFDFWLSDNFSFFSLDWIILLISSLTWGGSVMVSLLTSMAASLVLLAMNYSMVSNLTLRLTLFLVHWLRYSDQAWTKTKLTM